MAPEGIQALEGKEFKLLPIGDSEFTGFDDTMSDVERKVMSDDRIADLQIPFRQVRNQSGFSHLMSDDERDDLDDLLDRMYESVQDFDNRTFKAQ